MPNKIQVKNKFIQNPVFVSRANDKNGSQTTFLNNVIHNQEIKNDVENEYELISGEVFVNTDLTYENPVKIAKGTTFYLDDKANVIFKNKVIAIGTKEKKIKFIQAADTIPWGTVALLGNKTSGSVLSNMEFKGGSGSFVKQYVFTAMLSIHDTSNIKLKNINFYNNYLFDDMLHVIYSNNIQLENLYFADAFGDALDIDISKNILISNSIFDSSKNDGIDLMESEVVIKKVKIKKSKDKGISIGESSIAEIIDTKLIENKIGVAVKDASEVFIDSTEFFKNTEQIAAYKKNLQYGSGGNAVVTNSIFSHNINQFSSIDSIIDIKDSTIDGEISSKGKKIFIN